MSDYVPYRRTVYHHNKASSPGELTVAKIQDMAERAAQEILAKFWRGRQLPVDPNHIADELGITVQELDFSQDISGAIWSRPGVGTTIAVNKNDNKRRKRFTVAHELGHSYLRQDKSNYSSVDYRDSESTSGDNPTEVFANSFAAALLMPQDEVRRLFGRGLSPIDLAGEFDVSVEAMSWRLENLNLGY